VFIFTMVYVQNFHSSKYDFHKRSLLHRWELGFLKIIYEKNEILTLKKVSPV
jgi:hypothetical protein